MSVINTNITSMIGQSNLSKSQNALQTSMERLSSGLRINSAKDDAAGQAIANRMTAQITGLAQAQRNANDGISVAQTAEGSLNQVNDNLQRIRELSVQAENDTNSAEDLESIQNEIGQRLNEINRIAEETSFNGVKVLASDQKLNIQVGANDGETISINLQEINQATLGLNSFDVTKSVDVGLSESITENSAGGAITVTGGTLHEVVGDDGKGTGDYVIKDANGTLFAAEAAFDIATSTTAAIKTVNDGAAVPNAVNVKYSSDGEYVTATGTNGDRNLTLAAVATIDTTVAAEVDSVGEDGLFKGEVDQTSSTDANAYNPLGSLDSALKTVDSLRSDLGAVQNRFEDAITNLNTNETNLAAARSRIEDADYASEVANMTRAQILQQAGTSVLAQANQIPQNVLSLLG
ncbi:FliC/FljB family flagellin [Halomonas sp. PGE1]|uniref:FliC/FljB family flagellin n=1 Tax=Halomonas sp. PGE1 TaxID=2730360 RepID=UPI001476752C|nr:FliC/FljB family flagellin [Halomonas sp. PGE1]QJQ99846.1 FliC/FljB family flagellin [Halomonas sp. PGE1]